jgi:hypothetical protein
LETNDGYSKRCATNSKIEKSNTIYFIDSNSPVTENLKADVLEYAEEFQHVGLLNGNYQRISVGENESNLVFMRPTRTFFREGEPLGGTELGIRVELVQRAHTNPLRCYCCP